MIENFDNAASGYDQDFTHSEIGILQRKRVWKFLDKSLNGRTNLKILELNCGTGEDANTLAQKGNIVVASDISNEMLNVAKTKQLASKITFLKLDLNDLDISKLDTDFDLVFSNFGGINCIDHSSLNTLGTAISHVLKPKGQFIAVIMPKVCIWESLYFLLKRKPSKILRRNKEYAMVNVSGKSVKTWYYNPKSLDELIGGGFIRETLKPIGLFIPPSYMENFFKKRTRLLKFMNNIEVVVSNFSWQARFSDHFYIQYKLK